MESGRRLLAMFTEVFNLKKVSIQGSINPTVLNEATEYPVQINGSLIGTEATVSPRLLLIPC